ncbi:MAG: hypothetical protein QOJ19_777 [Acidimicrobiia bacterium]|jgi:hypothetical protein|nr:hypothetical protein [Acidimicrobiia bacterium]
MSKMHIAKRDIDRAKRAKAAEKRQRRQSGSEPAPRVERPPASATSSRRGLSDRELLARVESAHAQLESGAISQEEFDAIKAELLSLLRP